MRVRQLNDFGLAEFEAFIKKVRAGTELNIPSHLLEGEEYSDSIEIEVTVDAEKKFNSRYEIGVYLIEQFGDKPIQKYVGNVGFWSWFALLWFEQLCPTKNGKLKPSKAYYYVLSRSYNHRPRHSIYLTWQLVNRYGEDAQFMLCKEPSTRGEITEQMMARQDILSSEAAMKLASQLYFDPEKGSFKKGAAARKSAGCVSRYINWIQQIQLTFDIVSTTRDELAELLPREFDRFRESVPA